MCSCIDSLATAISLPLQPSITPCLHVFWQRIETFASLQQTGQLPQEKARNRARLLFIHLEQVSSFSGG